MAISAAIWPMVASFSVSALSGLLSSQTGVFLRTPKYAIMGNGGTWREKKYQLALNRVTVFETIATVVGSIALVYAAVEHNFVDETPQ